MLRRLRKLFDKWRRERQVVELTLVDQQVLRTLFEIGKRGASAREVVETVRIQRPADPLEVRLSIIKLLEVGLVEARKGMSGDQEVYLAAKRAEFLRWLIPERPTVHIDVWL